jgi:hypothetical protein
VASAIIKKLREEPEQQLSTEHIASLVGMVSPRAVAIETAMNRFRSSGLRPVGRFVFADDNFASSTAHNPTRKRNRGRDRTSQPEFCSRS